MRKNKIRAPSADRIFDGLKLTGLTKEDSRLIKQMCDGEKSSLKVGKEMGLDHPCFLINDGDCRITRILTIADFLVNKRGGMSHGVEFARSVDDTMREFNGLEYVNMGDTYDSTLIFDHKKGRFCVTSVGDIIESNMRRFE